MPSNNSKYSEEMREETAAYIIESRKSATRVSEELGIDTNTVCRWVSKSEIVQIQDLMLELGMTLFYIFGIKIGA